MGLFTVSAAVVNCFFHSDRVFLSYVVRSLVAPSPSFNPLMGSQLPVFAGLSVPPRWVYRYAPLVLAVVGAAYSIIAASVTAHLFQHR
jgi:hypothetical protein